MNRPRPMLPSSVAHDLEQIGVSLRRARVARGETQAALAARIGIAERTVRAAEGGDPGVASGTLFSLLWAVGLSGLGDELELRVDKYRARPTNIRARRKAVDDF